MSLRSAKGFRLRIDGCLWRDTLRDSGGARIVRFARVDRGRVIGYAPGRAAVFGRVPFGALPALVESRDTLVGEAVVVYTAERVAAQAVEGRDVAARDTHTLERVTGEAISGLGFLL